MPPRGEVPTHADYLEARETIRVLMMAPIDDMPDGAADALESEERHAYQIIEDYERMMEGEHG